MASAVKFYVFVQDLGRKVHNLNADTFKYALTNTAPTASSNVTLADITQITAANGYTSGGKNDGTAAYSQSSGTGTMTMSQTTIFTATGGSMAAFRYVVLYNSTAANSPLMMYWDYGSSVTLATGETFTIDNSGGVLTLA